MDIRHFTLSLDTEALQESCLASSIPHYYTTENIFNQVWTGPLLESIAQLFAQIQSEGAYYIHGWLNVYTRDNPSLGIHAHGEGFEGNYHGVFTVSSPANQYTEFLLSDGSEERVLSASNGMLIASCGDSLHRTTAVSGDEIRMTIAFDIINQDTYDTVTSGAGEYLQLRG